jgi:[ribosomal protein S5]-alanine N-acetyltransferase
MTPAQAATTEIRLIERGDAAELSELVVGNRAFLAPFEPERPPQTFTVDGQRDAIEFLLRDYERGLVVPHAVIAGDRIIGRVTLSNISRGAFQSCNLGYWIDEAHGGRGHASAAVAKMCVLAFGELGLHRVEAGTLLANARSQGVLRRNGFERIGVAPRYLKIAGAWQDHVLYQRLSPVDAA